MATEMQTTARFMDCLKQSGLLNDQQWKRVSLEFAEFSGSSEELAEKLIEAGHITRFQAGWLLKGKAKGFLVGNKKYKLLDLLGVGGMGAVYLCQHVLMNRLVAFKTLPDAQAKNTEAVERFYREARAAAALHHPNIVQAHDVDSEGQLHYLVMEYVEGCDLNNLVERIGPLAPARAAHYIAQASMGLQHAHENGLVHRDIKPSNLLLDRSGTIKILDMGLARFFNDQGDNLTAKYDENSVLGTADFLSPEQALKSSDADIRSDIYSLGATLYFLLTARKPFGEGTVTQKLLWHQLREPDSVRKFRPEVPVELEAVLKKMMAKKPEERYAEPYLVAEALAPWTQTPPPPPTIQEIPPRIGPGGGTPSTPGPSSRFTKLSGTHRPSRGSSSTLLLGPATADGSTAKVQPKSGTPPWVWAAIGAVTSVGILIAAGIVFSSRPAEPSKTPEPPARTEGKRLVVKAEGGDFSTLESAIENAKEGDTIVIEADEWVETLRPLGSYLKPQINLTIEGQGSGGKPTLWRPPAKHIPSEPLITVIDVTGLRIRNLILDGEERVNQLALLSGMCPGIVLENVEFRRFKQSGLRLNHCLGERDGRTKPIELARLRFHQGSPQSVGVLVQSDPGRFNRYVTLKDSRLDGPGRAAVLVLGATGDLNLVRCRISKYDTAVEVPPTDAPFMCRLQLFSNTIANVKSGIRLEMAPPPSSFGPWQINTNLFINVNELILVPQGNPDEYLAVRNSWNACSGGEQVGADWLKAVSVPVDGVGLDPADDATYLRYTADNPLAQAAPNKGPAGVPPPKK